MVKEITLTKGMVAIVDDGDFELLSQFKWHFSNNYACRRLNGPNLRIVTSSQNKANVSQKGGSSIYKGVSFNKARKLWIAYLNTQGRFIYIGNFKEEIDAATVYNFYAEKYHGEYARLNGVSQ